MFDHKFLCLLVFVIAACSAHPRLQDIEDWTSQNSDTTTRNFRENWVEPFVNGSVNPEHVLRATDILELRCRSKQALKVEGHYHTDAEEIDLPLVQGSVVRLSIGLVADFHALNLFCPKDLSAANGRISLCHPGNSRCVTEIGKSNWSHLHQKFQGSIVDAKLKPLADPVAYPGQQLTIKNEKAILIDEGEGPFISTVTTTVSANGLLTLPAPDVGTGEFTKYQSIPEKAAFRNALGKSLYSVEVVPEGSCVSDRVKLSTIASCLEWASSRPISIPKTNQTPSMARRQEQCVKLGIDENFAPDNDKFLNSWTITPTDPTVHLIVESGEAIEIPLKDGASLRSTVFAEYRRLTFREVINPSDPLRQDAFLTVQPRQDTCSAHSTPFFVNIAANDRKPIRLLAGDVIRVSRARPQKTNP